MRLDGWKKGMESREGGGQMKRRAAKMCISLRSVGTVFVRRRRQ